MNLYCFNCKWQGKKQELTLGFYCPKCNSTTLQEVQPTSTRQEFITKMKTLIKEYEAELDYSHYCDEANPVIIIKDGYTISLDDLFSEDE